MGVDIEALRRLADDDELYSYQRERILASADEIDALRKASAEKDRRIHQLERLVCSGWRVRTPTAEDAEDARNFWWVEHNLRPTNMCNDLQAAIDAAIKHMEASDGE